MLVMGKVIEDEQEFDQYILDDLEHIIGIQLIIEILLKQVEIDEQVEIEYDLILLLQVEVLDFLLVLLVEIHDELVEIDEIGDKVVQFEMFDLVDEVLEVPEVLDENQQFEFLTLLVIQIIEYSYEVQIKIF